MTRQFLFIFVFLTTSLFGQKTLKIDSFFLNQKKLPDNYKSIISDNLWQLIGEYHGAIKTPDTITIIKVNLFDNGKTYRKIIGNKIACNTDISTKTIIYVDTSTLILQFNDRKKMAPFVSA
ncbi:MAG: hypothetical protein IT236_17345 [Bacteroidia bacterium]|nr:hypothetical protein [Bacteroidia bacterium]